MSCMNWGQPQPESSAGGMEDVASSVATSVLTPLQCKMKAHDLDASALRQPARRTARLESMRLLAAVRDARDRLDHAGDDEALHDFRVAVRRLRSWLRAFHDVLDDTLSAKHERRLKRIARATGASRDLEVHITWVEDRRKALRGPSRRGADWLLSRLRERKCTVTSSCDASSTRRSIGSSNASATR